jgi:hypothetical protein
VGAVKDRFEGLDREIGESFGGFVELEEGWETREGGGGGGGSSRGWGGPRGR